MFQLLCITLALIAQPAWSDTVIATRTIRAQSILTPDDIMVKDVETPGAFTHIDEVVGQEARVALYAGRPVRLGEVGPPAIINRNQTVTLFFRQGALLIVGEGRALDRAGVGDVIRVMNTASRQTVSGTVSDSGAVRIGAPTNYDFLR